MESGKAGDFTEEWRVSASDHTLMLFRHLLSPLLTRLDRLLGIIEIIMGSEEFEEDLSDNLSEADSKCDELDDTVEVDDDDDVVFEESAER